MQLQGIVDIGESAFEDLDRRIEPWVDQRKVLAALS